MVPRRRLWGPFPFRNCLPPSRPFCSFRKTARSCAQYIPVLSLTVTSISLAFPLSKPKYFRETANRCPCKLGRSPSFSAVRVPFPAWVREGRGTQPSLAGTAAFPLPPKAWEARGVPWLGLAAYPGRAPDWRMGSRAWRSIPPGRGFFSLHLYNRLRPVCQGRCSRASSECLLTRRKVAGVSPAPLLLRGAGRSCLPSPPWVIDKAPGGPGPWGLRVTGVTLASVCSGTSEPFSLEARPLAGVDGQPGHITHAGPHQSAWPWSWDTR